MKKNYIIPYGERFINLCSWGKRSLVVVDGVGIVVTHKEKEPPPEKDIRNYLIGWNQQGKIHIQADTLDDALAELYSYPEMNTGLKHKAWEIADSEHDPVIEYAGCDHMRIKNFVKCARYDEPSEYGSMVCILDGLDEPPDDCPIHIQQEQHREKVQQIGGIWVRTFSALCASPQISSLTPSS